MTSSARPGSRRPPRFGRGVFALAGAQTTACLILDLRMPGMDVESSRATASRRPSDPRHPPHRARDDKVRSWALRAGVTAFLGKPFDAEALLSAWRQRC